MIDATIQHRDGRTYTKSFTNHNVAREYFVNNEVLFMHCVEYPCSLMDEPQPAKLEDVGSNPTADAKD